MSLSPFTPRRATIQPARPSIAGGRALLLTLIGAAGALAGVMGGCTNRGDAPHGPKSPPAIARAGVTRAGDRADVPRPATSPAPAPDRTSTSIRVEVRPLGSVPFDGLTLPLVACAPRQDSAEPDLWIATQHGATPPWPVLLADGTPGSRRVPANLRISAFRVVRGEGAMRAVAWERPLARGLILGRSADERGFLVEWPRADGSRWIGRVEWETGQLDWLVDDAGEAAFASLGPGGELAYSRRAAPGAPWELVVRARDGAADSERTLASPAGDPLVFPTFSADPARVYVLNMPGAGMGPGRMLAVDLPGDGRDLRVRAFADLNFEPSVGAAWQSVMCLATPWGPDAGTGLDSGLAFLSLETGSMAWMDGTTGRVLALARGTVGAAAWCASETSRGLMLGTVAELVFQPLGGTDTAGVPEFGPKAGVVRGSFVPRAGWFGAEGRCGIVLASPAVGGTSEEVGVFEVVSP